MATLDFDNADSWEPSLRRALGTLLSSRMAELEIPHQCVEDARDSLLSVARVQIIQATLEWIEECSVAAYHGTRLTAAELANVRVNGLLTLEGAGRKERLRRVLCRHPQWSTVQDRLDRLIENGEKGIVIGKRTGQVHLTLSKAGLTQRFNHYLTHGSEFDYHIAHQLLGQEGADLLAKDGDAYVLRFVVPGAQALQSAHRYFSPSEMTARGDVPNLINDLLQVLAFRIGVPSYTPDRRQADCGFVFSESIPAGWLDRVERQG